MFTIGVDLGGTNIAVGIVNEKYEIVKKVSCPTQAERDPVFIVDDIAKLIIGLCQETGIEQKEIVSVGIAAPGSVDPVSGVVKYANNLPFRDFPICSLLKERIECQNIHLENDANAAAWGEAVAGAAKGTAHSVMITLGTGVGGGVVIDHKLYSGFNYAGAELGHMVICEGGRQCTCGRKGCFEAYASASALIRDTKAMMKKHPISMLTEIEKELVGIDGRNAFLAAKRGDKYGQKLVDNYVKYLSEGLINYCNIFRPEAIILSGGIANEKEYLIDKVVEYLEKHTYGMKGSPKVEILNGQLGYDSGKIGAASLVLFE